MSSLFTKFYYDLNNHLFAMERNATNYFIATDLNGSPITIFDEDQNIVKSMHRTAFGFILEDSNSNFDLPFGFHGSVEIKDIGISIISE